MTRATSRRQASGFRNPPSPSLRPTGGNGEQFLSIVNRSTACRAALEGEDLVLDLFAGAGGALLGIEAALGRCVDIGINHDPLAVEMHSINHPNTRHLTSDVWEVDPLQATCGRGVGLLWASPDCTHYSRARGGRPREKKIRALPWVVIRWVGAVRPALVIMENVAEIQTWGPLDDDGQPIKARAGEDYRRWIAALNACGYAIETRELVAADYGTPTTRKRWFLIARCDGRPIVWPARTHAPRGEAEALGLRPWRAAAECIDWNEPCALIFTRKKPLAENTQRRIAEGIRRFVIECEEPFIVTCNHSGREFRGQSTRDPMCTLTAARDACGLVAPIIAKYHAAKGAESRCSRPDEPLRTLDVSNRFALVSAFLAKHYGGVVGHGMERPLGTVTAVDHHSLVSSHLAKFYGTARHGADVGEPMPTVTGQGYHLGEVRAFLMKYYGTGGQHQDCREPLHTITHKARFGLVVVGGQLHQIVDIGLRMLRPRELLAAQFGRFAAEYILIGTQAQQVAGIGNSVPPELACALVKCNVRREREAVVA